MNNESPSDDNDFPGKSCLSEDQHIELLATYDEALASGRTLRHDTSTHLPGSERLRFQANQQCLHLLEQFFPRQQPAFDEVAGSMEEEGFAAGQQLGRFTLVRELGSGGFGIVFLAHDPVLARHVALKVPRANVLLTPQLRERFLREARAAGRLNHPNLVRILDAGTAGPLCYIVSDYCAGPTLADWIKLNPSCSAREAAHIVLSIARALAYIHSQGILHRDIKPSNILLEPVGEAMVFGQELAFTPLLTDFGMARLVDADATQTATGAILGTPAYMAPEQALGRNKDVVPASDVYSLGAVLYELCTSRRPMSGSKSLEVLNRLVSEEIVPPRQLRRTVPRDLEAICLKCLERDPQRRYITAEALAADLDRFLAGRPTVARPISQWKRGLRQARRRPAFTVGMVFGAMMISSAIFGGNWYVHEQQKHQRERTFFTEREQRQTAEMERRGREHKMRQDRDYVNGIRLAVTHWQSQSDDSKDEVLKFLRSVPGEYDCREFAWHYLWRQGSRCVELRGHEIFVESLVFAPHGLLSASHDGSIKHWDLDARQMHGSLRLTRPSIRSAMFSTDGKRLGTMMHGKLPTQYYCWNADTGELCGEVSLPLDPTCEAISPDGQYMALAGRRGDGTGSVVLWEPSTSQLRVLWEHAEHRQSPSSQDTVWPAAARFSPNGKRLAIAFNDRDPGESLDRWVCELLDVQTSAKEADLLGHTSSMHGLAFSSDGATLATSDFHGSIKLWDLATGRERFTLSDTDAPIRCLAFSPDGKSLATGMNWPGLTVQSDRDYVSVWDLATRTKHHPPPFQGVQIMSLAFGPDGSTLAMGCIDNTIRLWDWADTFNPVLLAHGPKEAWGIAFAPNGKTFATCGDDHLVKVRDLQTKREIARCLAAPSLLLAVAFAPDRPLLATAGYDGVVRICNPNTGREEKAILAHQGPVRSLAFSPNGRLLATCGDDRKVILWNAATYEQLFALDGHTNKARQVVFSPDSQTLFSGDNDGVMNVWRAATGNRLRSFHENAKVLALAHAPQEPLLAIATDDAVIHLRRSDSLELQNVLAGHTADVLCVAFSPDGKTLASGSLDRSVRVWHVVTGQELLCFKDLPSQINGIAFSPDGQKLGATCHDGSVRFWQGAP